MIRERNGIEIQTDPPIVMDGARENAKAHIVTHAHMDHLPYTDDPLVCSNLTAALMEQRTGTDVSSTETTAMIDLIPSGHIIGSRAAHVHTEENDILYTGDTSLQDRIYLDGFEPPTADILVTEATYGLPQYRFPEQQAVVNQIHDWIQDTDGTVFLFGYSLGKAQKIQYIAQQSTNRDIYVHGSIGTMNNIIEEMTALQFDVEPYKENKDQLENSIVVFPSRLSRKDWIKDLEDRLDATTAGFSGWAADDSYIHRRGIDTGFPLSDHCDFDDLIELAEQVDPDVIYTQHGFSDALASHLRKEHGFTARSLKKNQTTLEDF
ncbi:MAG: hypothetical protein MUP66_00850 [Candidatus Nanohaloarchaeota archaeon QJJ-5]|nr:hypothetical protein [Candidatus Nanohaloarchaeota archaeon QJJ-5]